MEASTTDLDSLPPRPRKRLSKRGFKWRRSSFPRFDFNVPFPQIQDRLMQTNRLQVFGDGSFATRGLPVFVAASVFGNLIATTYAHSRGW